MKIYFTAGIITIIVLSTVGILVSAQLEQRTISIEISNATVDELTQKLDAAVAGMPEDDPTRENIQLRCTMDYPPAPGSSPEIIWCKVSNLFPPPVTTTTPWQKEIEGSTSNDTTETQLDP